MRALRTICSRCLQTQPRSPGRLCLASVAALGGVALFWGILASQLTNTQRTGALRATLVAARCCNSAHCCHSIKHVHVMCALFYKVSPHCWQKCPCRSLRA